MSINLSKALLASFAILLTPTISFAKDNPTDHCPSIAAIRADGLDVAGLDDESEPNVWGVVKYNDHYGTDYAWTFMTIVTANSKDEAIAKANAALSAFTFYGAEMGIYCYYTGTYNGELLSGVALPVSKQMRYSFQSMKSLIHQSSHGH